MHAGRGGTTPTIPLTCAITMSGPFWPPKCEENRYREVVRVPGVLCEQNGVQLRGAGSVILERAYSSAAVFHSETLAESQASTRPGHGCMIGRPALAIADENRLLLFISRSPSCFLFLSSNINNNATSTTLRPRSKQHSNRCQTALPAP